MSKTLAMLIAKKELEKAVKREIHTITPDGKRRLEGLRKRPATRFTPRETVFYDPQRRAMDRILVSRSAEQRASDVISRLYQSGLTPEQWERADAAERVQAMQNARKLISRELMLPTENLNAPQIAEAEDAVSQLMSKDFVAGCDAGAAYAKLYRALECGEQTAARLLPETQAGGRGAEILREAEKNYDTAVQRAFEQSYNGFNGDGLASEKASLERYGADKNIEKRLDAFPRIENRETLEKTLKECNPNYNKDLCWKVNCQRCVPTYELRSRGYDVTAKPRPQDIDHLSYRPFDVWVNAEIHAAGENGIAEIEDFLRRSGEGSRVQIIAQWKYGQGGHTFAAELRDGVVRFIDPQTGDLDASRYFSRVRTGTVKYCRIDNLKMTNRIFDCCEEVKRT